MPLKHAIANHLRPLTWYDRARELAWRIRPDAAPEATELTWYLDSALIRRMHIRWPRYIPSAYRTAIGNQVLGALRRHARVEIVDLPQNYDRVINIEAVLAGERRLIMIETSDYPEVNEQALADADLHFKMEFRREGYGGRERLLPGGYVPADSSLYRYLGWLRRLRDETSPTYEVYGRYGLSLEKRRRPMEILRSSNRFAFYGGHGKVRYSRYLQELAQAKICIDLPSMSSITFRMIDSLAIGCCIVGPPHTNQLQAPFIDGVHVAYCSPDYSDLEDVCARLLADETTRQALIANSRAFFDRYIHPVQLGAYYLHHCSMLFA